MSWTSTERYRIRPAPGGLALVQELLNTRAIAPYGEDVLADGDSGDRWLRDVTAAWAEEQGWPGPAGEPRAGDLERVRALRERLAALVTGEAEPVRAPTDVSLRPGLDEEGRVALVPVGDPGEWLEAAVWAQVLLAQADGTWQRLKLCREPACRSAFYDRSRNNSGVWHDVRRCGNAANLRASRARRKQQAAEAPAGE
ncbi:CGNR zinc finger domain-containing protein [Streptomyces althioticus]|uniref:CGNR zinc finger domain-containing protein n=1 Tax=Streptomyces TaxID=1883 RepID=UPI0021C1B1FC|nr:CGNR zinc finger domain-containing protein [Streptomyces lusitanus]WTC26914.1 CGNR zinc finger domain-containing protein [Streptomyces althioticus]